MDQDFDIGIISSNVQLSTMMRAALEAGKEIMKVYDQDFKVEQKDDKSPLTEADKKANDIINSFLVPTEIPIISEENKQIENEVRKHWNRCWIVDPVDGTKEFIKRNGEFTVNIAMVDNGVPQFGVIYVPAVKALYFGDVKNQIAFKSVVSSHDATIEEVCSEAVELQPKKVESDTVEVVGSRSHMNQETLDYIEEIKSNGKNVEIVSKGSSLKFCLVAEGNADVYPRFAPTMEWDTAAGQAICKAVGIEVISKETNKPLLYNKENLLNPWFLVSR
ncbi:MAG: 3'(2'),5'-bisphosphate nucleotidase CysQ [Bacteroidia bacterium]|nr:3'(2'),5'-bisphosphate nucleotidase CysQ [Bacteroidia bacterium]MBT8309677.1 3'(2'),5'-bisphosphate nucleotidase CysQ [Bacteroidia bacterium]NND11531.1 3'(2'),5'-bisphosphate nucleotidase CysQ [Flavobacteriaceae bacterium]NNK27463.1 3'(2'),5'-bisphosphate nucleotidase CysQ [Flavobacteriaceae bacterium]NNL60414.1 3'(2'),5'-bisphosphate nucleotidase CysQ [Flavobacteriaceae bacterium]